MRNISLDALLWSNITWRLSKLQSMQEDFEEKHFTFLYRCIVQRGFALMRYKEL